MFTRSTDSAEESQAWRKHFLDNRLTKLDLPWDSPYKLTGHERAAIEHSVQQFQLGEGSQGRRLLKRGIRYCIRVGDPHFSRALSLFIKEEQRHSAHLLRFMQQQGIPPLSRHWVDSIFRHLRGLAGLELSLRVLVTAEIIAVPYYRALGRATRSPLLRALSSRILADEGAHLRFQSSMLRRVALGRFVPLARTVSRMHRLFLIATVCVVWREHRSVFEAAGYRFGRLLRESLLEFAALDRASNLQRALARAHTSPHGEASADSQTRRI
jgi:rubrerythrin